MTKRHATPYRIHLVPITGPSVETTHYACGECRRFYADYGEASSCCHEHLLESDAPLAENGYDEHSGVDESGHTIYTQIG